MRKSRHQMNVEAFMLRMNNPLQQVPILPAVPSPEVRTLRARLILEEALETIRALGVSVYFSEGTENAYAHITHPKQEWDFEPNDDLNFIEVVDGCCDIKVVTTGTLSALGVADEAVQDCVDLNNLMKFAPGHHFDAGGKLIKPPGHRKPCLMDIIFNELDQSSARPIPDSVGVAIRTAPPSSQE